MSHKTYTTEAIVCGSFQKRTTDLSYRLFTKDFGMLLATARGVRKESSRQRYALQDFSYLKLSLIKGKNGWIVGSIEPYENFYHRAESKEARGSVVALCRFLSRFVVGNQTDDEMFTYVTKSLAMLANQMENRSFARLVVEVNLLSRLGYVKEKSIPKELLMASPAVAIGHYGTDKEDTLRQLYTQAITVSQL